MKSKIFSRFPFFSFLLIIKLLVLIQAPECSSNPDEWYGPCSNNFSCGTLTEIGYPFHSSGDPEHCGYPGFELNNCVRGDGPTIDIKNVTYRVLGINQTTQTLKIVRYDVIQSTCPQVLVNTTLDQNLFDYASGYTNLTFLYGCPDSVNIPGSDPLSCNGYNGVYVLPGSQGPGSCKVSVVVPVVQIQTDEGGSINSTGLGSVLHEGFEVTWKMDGGPCRDCTQSNGRCVYDVATSKTTCYCPRQPAVSYTCPAANTTRSGSTPSSPGSSSGSRTHLNIVIPIVGAILAGIGIGWLFFFCRQRRKRHAAESAEKQIKDVPTTISTKPLTTNPSTNFTASIPSYPSSKSEFGRSTYFGAQVFTYEELEKATENFDTSKELGDGGFGTVYYGKLIDGREVAVKRLYENNFKRVEQFLNEVEILTKLSHRNLVKLYGCTSKRSRELLLVYEYISNGTVADHLHGKLANSTSGMLSWPVRLNIAIETAEALTYLHESDIIHRDVKTNNILLDKNFRVKVADFGLSRLFPNDATHVSTAPQGTPGYVDPEYYQCYQLTDKSDVYSFGVVLIELMSSLHAVDTNRHRHDINLANMAINKIQNHMLKDLVDESLGFETDGSVRRMTTLVAELAFRCLQYEKDMRPSMKEVVENLRGIQNQDLNAQKAEVLDIVVDTASPPSPDSGVTDKMMNSSMPNSSEKLIIKSAPN